MKSSSCSQECLGECMCDILSISHTCMHTQSLNSLFLCSQLVRCEAAQIPRLHDHRAGPEQTLSLIKVYKLGLNATVACGLSKLCVCTVNAHSCLLCTGYPGEEEYQVFFKSRCKCQQRNKNEEIKNCRTTRKLYFPPSLLHWYLCSALCLMRRVVRSLELQAYVNNNLSPWKLQEAKGSPVVWQRLLGAPAEGLSVLLPTKHFEMTIWEMGAVGWTHPFVKGKQWKINFCVES